MIRFLSFFLLGIPGLLAAALPEVWMEPNGVVELHDRGSLGRVLPVSIDNTQPASATTLFEVVYPGIHVRMLSYAPGSICPKYTRLLLTLTQAAAPDTVLLCYDRLQNPQKAKLNWTFETPAKPEPVGNNLMARSGTGGRLIVQMLEPAEADRQTELFGNPMKDNPGYRNVITPLTPAASRNFLALLQLGRLETPAILPQFNRERRISTLRLQQLLTVLPPDADAISKPFAVSLPATRLSYAVLLIDLKPGNWTVISPARRRETYTVDARRPVLYLPELSPGLWFFQPQL